MSDDVAPCTALAYLDPSYWFSTSVWQLAAWRGPPAEGVAGGITCIDLSPVAVQRMRDRLAEQGTSGVDVVVDMLDMPFESESFDLVIEKGTMDALSVDIDDQWNPNPTTVDNIMKMLEGIHKVLKPGDIFVSITFGQPHFRPSIFEAPGFSHGLSEWSTFGDGFHYFFYTLQKERSLEPSGHQDKLLALQSNSKLLKSSKVRDYIFRTNVEEL
ncbi:hypothetical protein QYE76_066570 [Lolium multiflorum]|uniref:Methyltransferase domain-containing protein n=1 Tax=Lolium multiflorum TaxID=4521 RepID=A0AAD8SD82_LOLMU|nr:hypothetical protein QYE76_066570 [Lolium multiflorum]